MSDLNKILVIEDDPDIGMMLKMMLEFKGYAVTVCERPDFANTVIKESMPDLIIMDMLLSGANGLDICNTIKADITTANLPVIMISAHPHAQKVCLAAGADDFMEKPFEMDALLSKVTRFVSQH